jgi:hypothetical protein
VYSDERTEGSGLNGSKFSKVGHLFEISTRYRKFLETEPLHIKSACCFFVHCQHFPNFCRRQIVVNIAICCPEWSDIEYTLMSSPMYQNMVNLIVRLPIRRRPSKFMNVTTWKHCTFDSKILDVAKLTTLTPLSLLISYELSFPIVVLKISSLPTLSLKLPTQFSYGTSLYCKYTRTNYSCCYFLELFWHFLPWNRKNSYACCYFRSVVYTANINGLRPEKDHIACRSVQQRNFVHGVDGEVKSICR